MLKTNMLLYEAKCRTSFIWKQWNQAALINETIRDIDVIKTSMKLIEARATGRNILQI